MGIILVCVLYMLILEIIKINVIIFVMKFGGMFEFIVVVVVNVVVGLMVFVVV